MKIWCCPISNFYICFKNEQKITFLEAVHTVFTSIHQVNSIKFRCECTKSVLNRPWNLIAHTTFVGIVTPRCGERGQAIRDYSECCLNTLFQLILTCHIYKYSIQPILYRSNSPKNCGGFLSCHLRRNFINFAKHCLQQNCNCFSLFGNSANAIR